MRNPVKAILLLSSFLLLTAACQETTNSSGAPSLVQDDALTDINTVLQKTYLDDATYEQVAPYVKECRGGKQLCVQICHRPPGNPANYKNMLLPLAATKAHLNHGGDHADKDYLGLCHVEDAGSDSGADNPEGNGEEHTADHPNEEESSEGGSGLGSDEIPAWCETYYEVDRDCDGIDDITEEPIF